MMKVLSLMIDVSGLTEKQIEDLKLDIESKVDDYEDKASVLNCKVVKVDDDGSIHEEDTDATH